MSEMDLKRLRWCQDEIFNLQAKVEGYGIVLAELVRRATTLGEAPTPTLDGLALAMQDRASMIPVARPGFWEGADGAIRDIVAEARKPPPEDETR